MSDVIERNDRAVEREQAGEPKEIFGLDAQWEEEDPNHHVSLWKQRGKYRQQSENSRRGANHGNVWMVRQNKCRQ